MNKLCTVITATTGNPILKKCIESVERQSHTVVQHLIFIDGKERHNKVYDIIDSKTPLERRPYTYYNIDVVPLPYSIGKDRWNGHRIYGSGAYIAEGEFVMFLDDDNYLEPNHIEECLKVIESGKDWSYSLRSLVSPDGVSLGKDDCESLGKWSSILHPQDYFIDVNCYFLPRKLAVGVSPLWFRKFREPGQPEVDRVLCSALRANVPNFDCSYKYSVNYTVGNTGLSVTPEFFQKGNEEMLRRYKGNLPWKK